MTRKNIVAGNWKMNTTWAEACDLTKEIITKSKEIGHVEKIIFPPFPFLQPTHQLLVNEDDFFVGAQNCNQNAKGAYTGEVSAEMIKSIGCNYVLIGHSERRIYFNETNEQLISKIKRAIENNLKIVFCFGEQLAERKNNQHFETVKTQLEEVLKEFPKNKTQDLVLAYEPVWAIGTGETASPSQAQEMHAYVRGVISNLFSANVADLLSILYGGSCNAQNAKELFACNDVDGGLIGGASLKADDFCKIMSSFS